MGGGPCAQSGLTPTQVMIWNLDTKEVVIMSPVKTIDCHQDVILSMSFNTNGSLLATTCKDRKIRILDPRAGTVLQVSGGSGSGLGSEEQGVEWGQRRLLSLTTIKRGLSYAIFRRRKGSLARSVILPGAQLDVDGSRVEV